MSIAYLASQATVNELVFVPHGTRALEGQLGFGILKQQIDKLAHVARDIQPKMMASLQNMQSRVKADVQEEMRGVADAILDQIKPGIVLRNAFGEQTRCETASRQIIGKWFHSDGSLNAYEITFRNGEYLLTQEGDSGIEVRLCRGAEWFEGRVASGYVRLKLIEDGRMLSQYKLDGELDWHDALIATREPHSTLRLGSPMPDVTPQHFLGGVQCDVPYLNTEFGDLSKEVYNIQSLIMQVRLSLGEFMDQAESIVKKELRSAKSTIIEQINVLLPSSGEASKTTVNVAPLRDFDLQSRRWVSDEMIGRWYYSDESQTYAYEIGFKGEEYVLYQNLASVAVDLCRRSEWLEGKVSAGYIRLKLIGEGQMLSQFRGEDEHEWTDGPIATREIPPFLSKEAPPLGASSPRLVGVALQEVLEMVGRWYYSDASQSYAFDIDFIEHGSDTNIGGGYVFYQHPTRVAVHLVRRSEWLEGRVSAGHLRLKLIRRGQILLQVRLDDTHDWADGPTATRAAPPVLLREAPQHLEVSSHAESATFEEAIGSWYYSEGGEAHAFEISNRDGEYLLVQRDQGDEVKLQLGPKCFEGRVALGLLRLNLIRKNQILLQYKRDGDSDWSDGPVALFCESFQPRDSKCLVIL